MYIYIYFCVHTQLTTLQVDAVLKLEDSDTHLLGGAPGTASAIAPASTASLDEYPYPRLVFQQKGSYLIWRNTLKPLTLDQSLMVQQGVSHSNRHCGK
jgi:hypothetical protein